MRPHNNRRRAVCSAFWLVALVALALSGGCRMGGCSGRQPGKLCVGFAQTENDGPWRIAETQSMRDEAARLGHAIIVTDARGDTANQVSNLEDLIAQRVDAIFLAPRESRGFEGPLQAAKDAGIPVIIIDRELEGAQAGQDYVTFIGSNFKEEGKRAGDWLVQKTGGKAGIIELLGTAGSSVARDRHDGFAEAIASQPGMKIIASQDGNFSRAQGQKVMENLLQAHGKAITVVYTHNDEMGLGAIQALRAAGMEPGRDVIVLSIDGQKSALEAIVRGEMNATVECNPRFGPVGFQTLERFRRGEPIPPKIINEDRFFDSANAAQFVGEAY